MKERKPVLLSEVWQQYVKDVLKDHPDYSVKNKMSCTKNYYILDKNGKEVTNFERFNKGIQMFLYHAGDILIETGGVLVLPIGKMILTRIETHPMSKQVDFKKTMEGQPREDGTRQAVYKTNSDWVKINFISDLETSYEFIASKPSCKPVEKSLVGRLCNILKNNPISRLKYEYQPLDREKASRKLVKD